MYQLFIGCTQNHAGHYKPVSLTELRNLIDIWFENYTITTAIGRYRGKNEETLIIYVSGYSECFIREFCLAVKTKFNQDCIGVLTFPDIQFF